eukprot:5762784-Pyramimonas_sp.AAC.1
MPAAPPEQQEPQEAGREIMKMSGRRLDAIKPSIDLKGLPGKLMKASPAEEDRLLRGAHERFWHNSPKDMLRLLQAALIPKDIILKGVHIARDCSMCQSQQRHLHAPTTKSQLSTIFNEVVQHD